MRLSKFIKITAFITALAVVYIHMQMKIIQLAYQGKEKERYIHKLVQVKGNLTYSILNLKSPNHLGQKLLSEESDMHFIGHSDVVQIITSEEFLSEGSITIAKEPQNRSLLSYLSDKIEGRLFNSSNK